MLKNFGPYSKEINLDFTNKRIIAVTGPNESGKSTLLRAICYAIYGKIPVSQDIHKLREIQLVNDSAKGNMVVEVELSIDNTRLTIQRGRTRDNVGFVKVGGKAVKKDDGQILIGEAVRLSYTDFIALSYFVQGDINQFMLGDKGAYFRRWTSSLSMWQDLSDSFRQDYINLSGQLDSIKIKKESLQAILKDKDEEERNFKSANLKLDTLQKKITRLTEIAHKLEVKIKVIVKNNQAYDAGRLIAQQMGDLSRHNRVLTKRVDAITEEFRQIKKGTCPILNIQCQPLSKKGDKKRKILNKELRKLKLEIKKNTEKQTQLEDTDTDVAEIPSDKFVDSLRKVKEEILTANSELQRCHAKAARAKVRLDDIKKAKTEIESCNAHINALSTKIKRSQFLQFMCGKGGIPSQIMQGELERVEDKCNWVLDRLDYSKRIRFAAYKELAGYEIVCSVCGSEKWSKHVCKHCGASQQHKRKDDPSVTVFDGIKERPFSLESGGGQALQSFAVRLAGSLFVASMTGVDLKMVMLDEILAHLDSENRQKLMSLIVDKLNTEFGLEQQFVVSHHDDVINAVDDLLIVSKDRGTTVAKWQ
jgi:DNA repair exonuclease SbcCD ATPase subunit